MKSKSKVRSKVDDGDDDVEDGVASQVRSQASSPKVADDTRKGWLLLAVITSNINQSIIQYAPPAGWLSDINNPPTLLSLTLAHQSNITERASSNNQQ
ncbi:hypothetical protein TWF481_009864 [Arthrobotrys musiformis]|uniref:Uncharacterized protein n=1 Tax=Arthrobotrys musiformis TaxID=47236 RepID=A0AAV9WAV3_9PEZI